MRYAFIKEFGATTDDRKLLFLRLSECRNPLQKLVHFPEQIAICARTWSRYLHVTKEGMCIVPHVATTVTQSVNRKYISKTAENIEKRRRILGISLLILPRLFFFENKQRSTDSYDQYRN